MSFPSQTCSADFLVNKKADFVLNMSLFEAMARAQ